MCPSFVINSFVRICLSCSGEFDVFVDVQLGFVFLEKRLNFLNSPFSWKLSSFLWKDYIQRLDPRD